MSDLLSIGASGVRAYQSALTTVSDNIANVGVTGYSRRTTDLREVTAVSAISGGRALSGNGVAVAGIGRQADEFRAQAVRNSESSLSRTQSGATWLSAIEDAMTGARLGERTTEFFSSARNLAADPTSEPQRAVLLEKAGGAAIAFSTTGEALSRATAQLDATAAQSVSTLNSLGAAMTKVNDGLARTGAGSAQAAQLMDQRDQLLEQMSGISDLDVQYDAIGRAEVRLGGSSGPVFVRGNDVGTVSFARNDDGAVQFGLVRGVEQFDLSPSGGALAGIAEGAQRLANATAAVDALATEFVAAVNGVQAGGSDLNGAGGAAIFAVGDRPTAISVAMTDPRGIAAARAGAPANSRDASNLGALETARTGGRFETRVTTLVTDNAAALEQKKLVAEAQGAIRDSAVSGREAASGVDLDAEAVELMRFQQAYQASSRVIQAARDIFQTLLEIR